MLRLREGLSVRALADAIGMDNGNLSKLENGKAGYSQEVIQKIADVLNVSVGMLFSEPEALEAAVLNMRELPVLSAEQLAVWADPDSFDPSEKQAYLHTNMRMVSRFGFGWVVGDEANAPRFRPGFVLIFDAKRQPAMGTDVIAQDRDGRVYIGQCRISAENEVHFAVVPRNRVYPIVSPATAPGLIIRGTLAEIREYVL